MIPLSLCLIALVGTYRASRSSLGAGVGALLTVGYLYGIVRANQPGGVSHVLFDSSLLGLYAARLFSPIGLADRVRLSQLQTWLIVLVAWPTILFFVPTQDVLVELVGWRGNVLMLPCLMIGARLTRNDVYTVAKWVAVLNIVAALVAAAEFVLGIEPFFPRNAVTEIIYRSSDVARFTAHRIPSIFLSSHAYGGAMVLTLPLLIGAWMQRTRSLSPLFGTAILVSALGVFVAAARFPVILLLLLTGTALASGRVNLSHRLRWIVVGAIVGFTVAGQERLQRFTTLQDPEFLAERVAGSVNLTFFELVARYPLGNGLGGGGTSIPYFLMDRVRNSVTMENEYARIALEQGIPGVIAWALFVVWLFTRNVPTDESWSLARRLVKVVCAGTFASGMIGTGLLAAIPGTAIMLLTMGWVAVPDSSFYPPPAPRQYGIAIGSHVSR